MNEKPLSQTDHFSNILHSDSDLQLPLAYLQFPIHHSYTSTIHMQPPAVEFIDFLVSLSSFIAEIKRFPPGILWLMTST